MDNFRIIVLALIFLSVDTIQGNALVTDGTCSDEVIILAATCTAPGFRLSDLQTNVTFKIEDVDTSVPPYQAWIRISAFWDTYGSYGYSEVGLQAGNTYIYTNPSDSNDFVRFEITAIGGSGDSRWVEFGNIEYQQTSYVGSGGSDSNSGKDTGNSWKTIAHGLTTVNDGEDIIITIGNNSGQDAFIQSSTGILNSPVIVRGYGSGSILDYSTGSTGTIFGGNTKNFIEFRNFSVANGCVYFSNYGTDIFFDGMTFGHRASCPSYVVDIAEVQTYSTYTISNSNFENYSNGYGIWLASGSSQVYNNYMDSGILTGNPAAGNFYDNVIRYSNKQVTASGITYDGNYWYLYSGIDVNGNKVGDSAHNIDPAFNIAYDNYPKMDREFGYIRYPDAGFVDNATVYQLGAEYRNTTTDANGYYALSTIGRDTVTLFATKGSSYGNGTFDYDDTQANFTINISDYNNTNAILFSSDLNPDNEINHSAIDMDFWVNVWIQDYDPDHDYYSVRVYYPNGDLKDPDINVSAAQPAQAQYKINSNEDYGNYLFISHSYYFDEDLANNTILIHNASDVNDSVHNCDCIDHCTLGYFVSTRFCINPYADYASMYFSSDVSGLNKISSAYFNHTVYLQISHPNGDYANYSYNISILKPDNSPFYNWTTMTEYGYASWYTPAIATGTWTVNFIRKNLTDSSEMVMNTTTLYLNDEGTPPPIILSSISGYVREAGSLNPIYQASVIAGSYSASTNAVGYYNLTDMLNGNYTITASKTGYNSASVNKTINNASLINVNFLLNCTGVCPTPTPTGSPTPTPTSTGGGITPGSTTDADIANMFWTMLFLIICLYGVAFFWTIGDKE